MSPPVETPAQDERHQAEVIVPSNVTPFAPAVAMPTAKLDHVSIEDCDTLWDWVRADRDGTTAFLGREHKNSQSFHEQIAHLFNLEQQRSSWVRAIRRGDVLCGFIMLNPIVRTPQLAGTVHLYIAPEQCVDMSAWLPSVFAQLPSDMILMLVDARGTFTEILKPIGFQPNTVLTRPVKTHDVVAHAD